MSNLVSNEVNSVITFVEPMIKFSAVKSPATYTSPFTSKRAVGVVLPIQTFPLDKIVIRIFSSVLVVVAVG